jgi:hypothetical protein
VRVSGRGTDRGLLKEGVELVPGTAGVQIPEVLPGQAAVLVAHHGHAAIGVHGVAEDVALRCRWLGVAQDAERRVTTVLGTHATQSLSCLRWRLVRKQAGKGRTWCPG